MGEAIKNLVVLVWTVSAINSGADASVVSEYSLAEENRQQEVSVALSDSAINSKRYGDNEKNVLSANNS